MKKKKVKNNTTEGQLAGEALHEVLKQFPSQTDDGVVTLEPRSRGKLKKMEEVLNNENIYKKRKR